VYYGKGEIDIDPNQTQIDYDDIADSYDGSMKHKQVVNTILNKHYKTKNK